MESCVRPGRGHQKARRRNQLQLLRHDKDANHIVHFSEWSSLDQARRYFESPELVEIRNKADVKAPQFIYLRELERGVL